MSAIQSSRHSKAVARYERDRDAALLDVARTRDVEVHAPASDTQAYQRAWDAQKISVWDVLKLPGKVARAVLGDERYRELTK